MAYENAIRILKNREARIASTAEGIYDQNLVILFWEGIESAHIDECVAYLNNPAYEVVTGPVSFFDVSFDDDLYHLHAYYSEKEQRLYRLLMPSPATSSSFAETTTLWKLLQGEVYTAGQSNVVLQIPNVHPDNAFSIVEEALDETYTDSIYMITGVNLSGEWFSRRRDTVYNADTGYYTVRWFLSRYETSEFGIIYRDNPYSTTTELHLLDLTTDLKADFEENTYFDTDGSWYYSTAGVPGTGAYTRKNGEAASGTLPATSTLITATVDGRTIDLRAQYDDRQGNWRLTLLIKHFQGGEEFGLIYRDSSNSVATEIRLADISEDTKDDFLSHTYFDASGNWYYAADDANYTKMNGGATASTALPSDAKLVTEQVAGRLVEISSNFDESEKNWMMIVQVRQLENAGEMGIIYREDYSEISTEINLVDIGEADKQDFEDNVYIDASGNWYYASNGCCYTKKNGSAVSPTIIESITFSGATPSKYDGVYNFDSYLFATPKWVHATDPDLYIYRNDDRWSLADDSLMTFIFDNMSGADYPPTTGWVDADPPGNGNTPPSSVVNGAVTVYPGLPTDAKKISTQVAGRSVRVRSFFDEREKNWNVTFMITHTSSDTRISRLTSSAARITLGQTPNVSMVIDEARNITKTQLDTLEGYYSSASSAGTTRSIKVDPQPNGLYNATAVEIVTTGLASKFTIAGITHYFGWHHAGKPTSSASIFNAGASGEYYLLDQTGSWPAAGTDFPQTVIPDVFNVSREDDGTWSWHIRLSQDQELTSTGDNGAVDSPGTKYDYPLFRWGTKEDETAWIGRFSAEDLPNGMDLRGEYKDIEWNAGLSEWIDDSHPSWSGAGSVYSGRRIVIASLRNERVDDQGKVSYDVYRRILTASMADSTDGWFLVSSAPKVERKDIRLASETVNNVNVLLDRSSQDNFFNDTLAKDHALKTAGVRYKECSSAKRERKYFIRRPLNGDLSSSGILAEMNAAYENMGLDSIYETVSFDIVRISEFSYAVDRISVMRDGIRHYDEMALSPFEGELYIDSRVRTDFDVL